MGVAVGAAVLSARSSISGALAAAAGDVCDLIESDYYRADEPDAQAFIRECRALAKQRFASKTAVVSALNEGLSALSVSHLFVFDPAENRRAWRNESVDTGLRVRSIDGSLVVREALAGSPADRAGLRSGDVIRSVDGRKLTSASAARTVSGRFRVVRLGRDGRESIHEAHVQAEDFLEDLSPSLADLGGGVVHLRVPSFLPHYFEREDWLEAARATLPFRAVILDLRDNAGGSFTAMLRAASLFFCRGQVVGTLAGRPGRLGAASQALVDLPDDLDSETQIAAFERADRARLRAFGGYPCFSGPAIALIDEATSSTAEILADAIARRPRSTVWGRPSAGQVVMARWFPLPRFGGDFSVAIPIAGYTNALGHEIEGRSVEPSRRLSYDLRAARLGGDSWIAAAAAQLRRVSAPR